MGAVGNSEMFANPTLGRFSMCCSAWPASFSKTITGTWEVLVEGRVNHVLWYQNHVGHEHPRRAETLAWCIDKVLKGADWFRYCQGPMREAKISVNTLVKAVENKTNKPFPHEVPAEILPGDGNCLIVPLLGTWESIHLLNTAKAEHILDDIAKALVPPPSRGIEMDMVWEIPLQARSGSGRMVFLQFDIYDIVLAEHARDISSVLPQIQESKRPKVNSEVFETFDSWYNCPVALCCFNSNDSGTAKPLAFAFEPLYPDKLVVYTLDGHDGAAPDPTANVQLDHDIFVGSYLMKSSNCAQVEYQDFIYPDLKKYMLEDILGTQFSGRMQNGDFVFSTEAVRAGHFEGMRSLPPFGPHHLPRVAETLTRIDEYAQLGRPRRRL